MKFLLFVLVALLGSASAVFAAAEVSGDRLERFDALIEAARLDHRIPGVAVAVVQGTNVVFGKGYGEGITVRTPFKIGSLSKSFVAVAILQLVERGMMDLDAPVRRYLPWFRTLDEAESDRITVRHLLHHRSGIEDRDAGFESDRSYARELTNLVQATPRLRVKTPPGSRFKYSNTGYDILGAVVTTVSGVPFPDYVRVNIFEPLGMRRSTASVLEARGEGLLGYRYWFGVPVAFDGVKHHPPIASGGLISCAEDLARYLMALMNGGTYDGGRVLDASSTERLFAPYEERESTNYYALAWGVSTEGSPPVRVILHSGAVDEFLSELAFRPDERLGVILLVNALSYAKPGLLQFVLGGPPRFLRDQPPATWTEFHPNYYKTAAALLLVGMLPFAQGMGVVVTCRMLVRWRTGRVPRPTRQVWLRRWWLPLVGHVGVVVVLVWLLPAAFDVTLVGLIRAVPDWGMLAAVVAGCAVVWGTLRSYLVGRALRRLAGDSDTFRPPPASIG